jgi:hypothetical protein
MPGDFICVILNRPLDFTGTQATGADVDSFYLTLDESFNALDVGFPGAFGLQVRVADIHAGGFAFATDFAYVGH